MLKHWHFQRNKGICLGRLIFSYNVWGWIDSSILLHFVKAKTELISREFSFMFISPAQQIISQYCLHLLYNKSTTTLYFLHLAYFTSASILRFIVLYQTFFTFCHNLYLAYFRSASTCSWHGLEVPQPVPDIWLRSASTCSWHGLKVPQPVLDMVNKCHNFYQTCYIRAATSSDIVDKFFNLYLTWFPDVSSTSAATCTWHAQQVRQFFPAEEGVPGTHTAPQLLSCN